MGSGFDRQHGNYRIHITNHLLWNPQQIHSHLWPNSPSSITTDRTGFHNEYNHPKHYRCVCRRTKPEKLQTSTDLEESEFKSGASTQRRVPDGKKTNPAASEPRINPCADSPTNHEANLKESNHTLKRKQWTTAATDGAVATIDPFQYSKQQPTSEETEGRCQTQA